MPSHAGTGRVRSTRSGAILGGYAGGALGERVGGQAMRWLVVAIGIAMAAAMFLTLGR